MRIHQSIITLAILAATAWVYAGERPELALGRDSLHDYDPPTPGSYGLPALKPAGDGTVVGEDGRTRQLNEMFKDNITVLAFIYTRCNDPRACPYATRVLYQIHQISEDDPVLARNLHLLTMSFDPSHDTPEVMAEYRQRYETEQKGAKWSYLTTRNVEAIRPILASYGQAVDRKKNPKDQYGPISHQLRVFLIDRHGMVRNIYSYDVLDPRLVITDVRTLLLEEQSRLAKGESR
jgi:protein SCO1/2